MQLEMLEGYHRLLYEKIILNIPSRVQSIIVVATSTVSMKQTLIGVYMATKMRVTIMRISQTDLKRSSLFEN
jgi:hypothetical protein